MLTLDGSQGEGGGQILRTSLALSLVTGTAFRLERIRARREKPGLQRQHLTAVLAAQAVGDAVVDGAELRSSAIEFRPGTVRTGTHAFDIGTAGSGTLVLQTVLPPLAVAGATSVVTVEGGTHNPGAPPFDFLDRAFLPLLARMGMAVETELERYGFYPAGGGRFRVAIGGVPALRPLTLLDRGPLLRRHARAFVSNLPASIGERELRVVRDGLDWTPDETDVVPLTSRSGATVGSGNVLVLEIASAHVTEVVTAFGQIGVRAEAVAERAVAEARGYLATDAPVGEHLADQLLVPLALARGGAFRTVPLTLHSSTNMDVIRRFLDVEFSVTPADGAVVVEVAG
jgi:RNA 3'-terminal phosphate cyclase (ATP)